MNSILEQRLPATIFGSSKMFAFAALFLLLLPFLQMGLSYYVSVQALLFVLLLLCIPIECYLRNSGYFVALFLLMVVPSFFYQVDNQMHMLLGVLRQWVCACVLLAAISFQQSGHYGYQQSSHFDHHLVEKLLMILAAAFLALVAVQSAGLQTGHYWLVPSDWLVANMGTLKGAEHAFRVGLGTLLRPTGTFGEPSYLAFVMFSLLFMVFAFSQKKYALVVMLLIAITCFVARSLAGVLAVMVLSFAYMLMLDRNERKLKMIILIGAVGYTLLLFNSAWFSGRLGAHHASEPQANHASEPQANHAGEPQANHAGEPQANHAGEPQANHMDPSTKLRMLAPFPVIKHVFGHYPLGMPKELLAAEYGKRAAIGTENGALNIFINFGYSGFLIWGLLLFKVRRSPIVIGYVVLASMFNGAFLAIDKVAIIGSAILISAFLTQSGNAVRTT